MKSAGIFITHARTLEQLRAEFLSDIHRRLYALDVEATREKRTTKAAAINKAKFELDSLLDFWTRIQIVGSRPAQRTSKSEPKKC